MRPGGTKPGFPQHFHSQLLILWKDPFFPNRWFTRALLEFLSGENGTHLNLPS